MNLKSSCQLNRSFANRMYMLIGCVVFLVINISSANANIDSIFQSLRSDKSDDQLLKLIENNPHKQKATSSGLNSELQALELTQAITEIYSNDWIPDVFWDDFQNKEKVQNTLGVSEESYQCIIENHNYDTFTKMISNSVNDYIKTNSSEKVHNDLLILIDSGLADEYHDFFQNIFKFENETAANLFQLHLMQDPYLRMGAQLQSSDESLSKLIGVVTSNQYSYLDTLFGRHLFQVMTHCGVHTVH